MKIIRFGLALLAMSLSGCGLYTPDIGEFWSSPGSVADKKKAIIAQVYCELKKSLQILIKDDMMYGQIQPRQLTFLENGWGADILLVLTVDEKSSLSPNISLNTPIQNAAKIFAPGLTTTTPQSYSLTLGGQLSSEGYRQEKVHIFYDLADLIGPESKLPSTKDIRSQSCAFPVNSSTLFIESDLKIEDWLDSYLAFQDSGLADFRKKNPMAKAGVLSDEIRFEIVSAGNVTPTWKLLYISANTVNSPLYNASRDRTQDLTITIAPAKDGSLSTPQGQSSLLSSELNATLRSLVPLQ